MSSHTTPTDRSVNLRIDADLTTTVYLGTDCYHTDRDPFGPGCPSHTNLERGTLADAARKSLRPCRVCSPTDYRAEEGKRQ